MQNQEKQDYLSKIQNLIESGEKENIKLALQLMQGLGLGEDVWDLYSFEDKTEKEETLEDKLVFEFKEGEVREEITRNLLRSIERFMDEKEYGSTTKRKIFNICSELFRQATHYKCNEISIYLSFYTNHIEIARKTVDDTPKIIEDILAIKKYNFMSRQEFKKAFHKYLKRIIINQEEERILWWLEIKRRNSKHKMYYDITPYNDEKAIFTVIVKVDLPQ